MSRDDEDDITQEDIQNLTAEEIEANDILTAAIFRQLEKNPKLMKELIETAIKTSSNRRALIAAVRRVAKRKRRH